MKLTEITTKWAELDAEYDALTEKIQAWKHEMLDKHGYTFDQMHEMAPTACRKQFDRQTEIEAEIKNLDTAAQTIMVTPEYQQ